MLPTEKLNKPAPLCYKIAANFKAIISMNNTKPRAGYTLPVFATAAAQAALQHLQNPNQPIPSVKINLIQPNELAEIPIEQVASLSENSALAITRSDPGDNLDLTRNTPIWAKIEIEPNTPPELIIKGGEGIGRQLNLNNQPAIYSYAKNLLQENLKPQQKTTLTIILPEGRFLATRTSNSAFGVIEGLSLLGTTGISQPHSAPGQLDIFSEELQKKACQFDSLVLCIGENGLDLAQKTGIPPERLIKTANWLGPMLALAATCGVKSILLFGYHGKLIKLAGGIFHTHHHLADGRIEIITAHAAKVGIPSEHLQTIFQQQSAEDILNYLQNLQPAGQNWLNLIYQSLAETIDTRSQQYIHDLTEANVQVGTILFNRKREIFVKSKNAATLLPNFC